MKYPPVPLVSELTLPIFFCLSLPYLLILIIMVVWLRLLLNEGKLAACMGAVPCSNVEFGCQFFPGQRNSEII
uniref:Uncharacterized protein n=1 Tax=Coturnix japonica TaxID=93934 RepID=A0A8C2UID7_COTJA